MYNFPPQVYQNLLKLLHNPAVHGGIGEIHGFYSSVEIPVPILIVAKYDLSSCLLTWSFSFLLS